MIFNKLCTQINTLTIRYFKNINTMGNTACCKTDSRTGFDSEIIQIHQQQLPQPPPKETSQESVRIQQYLSNHPVIKRILREAEVKQQQQKIINKDTFFYAKPHQMTDGIFVGQQTLDNRKKNGFGVMIYNDSSLYQGEWKNDMKHGKGVLANQSGQYFCGDWVQDYPHGQGIYCILDPYAYYKGQWTQGLKHGQGAQHDQDGSKYVGNFVYGEKSGHGKLIYSDGTQYEGEFKNNKPEGLGKFKGKGHTYEGSWKSGKMHGAGTSYWHDQDNQIMGKYLGQYKQGIKQGYGQYTDSKGTVYRAMWVRGEINEHAPVDVQKSN